MSVKEIDKKGRWHKETGDGVRQREDEEESWGGGG